MKSVKVMLMQGVFAIAAAMLSAELIARAGGSGFRESALAAGGILLAGYLAGAVYLLRHRSLIGRWTRTRLVISLLTPLAVGVMVTAQPMTEVNSGILLIFGTIAAVPLLWLGAHDVARGLRGLPPETYSLDNGNKIGYCASLAWGFVACLILAAFADILHLERVALATAGILTINGSAEIGVLAWLFVLFLKGGLSEMANTLMNGSGSTHYAHVDDDDLLDWDTGGIHDGAGSSSMFQEIKIFNPSTGLEMNGGVDTAGNLLGEDPWRHITMDDSFQSHDGGISGSSWHDT